MENLIEEIEKIIEDLKFERQKCFEEIDYPLSQVDKLEGRILAYTDIVMALNQYNIITAPKSIKLSEIVDILKECYHTKIKIIKKPKKYYDCYLVCRKSLVDKEEYELLIRNNVIGDIDEFCCYPKEDIRKWLYTLWIAGTEIVDDLECDDNEN